MPFPPDPVATDKSNAVVIEDDHPAHHNLLAEGLNDTVAELVSFETAMATALAGKPSSLTPWTSDIDAATFDVTNVGVMAVGTATPTALTAVTIGTQNVATANSQAFYWLKSTALTGSSYHYSNAGGYTGGSWTGLNLAPRMQLTASGTMASVNGMTFVPTIIGDNTGTVTAMNGVSSQASVAAVIAGTVTSGNYTANLGAFAVTTTAVGLKALVAVAGFSTLTTGVGVDVASTNAGTFTTMVGLRVTSLAGGSTVWGMQVGDYQSYHHGRMTFGATTAPVYGVDLQGTAQDRGVIGLTEAAATPTNPTASGQCVLYMKGDKFVIGYLDGATMRYKYLDLTGTGVTWVHTTSAP